MTPTPASDRRPSILIVDDEAGILDSLRILLKGEGFEPRVALGGRQGLTQLEAEGYGQFKSLFAKDEK